ncbi:MAG TPA: ATP-binding cassette domain-containing protein [Romboutsia timonensis]|uniref:ATP-binding cassette domain-containing protein n=1 Tax=Romboutsia timonensis TaxID=1776391 RepID=A0A921N0U6_9FIRM|nr:ATP-binding cassette domain-containing protein [uncultured Romboutsia sp.]HJG96284.1 ATP-binding cassette domain-containing protein [Romboutsia timonensis]
MIKLNNLTKTYIDSKISIKSTHFNKENSYLILGPSGSGKSTMLNLIGGLIKPTSGSIQLSLNNQTIDITNLKDKQLRKLRLDNIGYILQDFKLFDDFTVKDNIEILLNLSNKKISTQQLKEILKQVGLEHKINSKVKHLSGGEKQRVAIARVLANDYDILLCDEPTGSLNKSLANELIQLIIGVHKKAKNTLIVVSHDETMAKYFDEVVRFENLIEGSE